MSYPRIASLKTADAFAARLHALGLTLGFDPIVDADTAAVFAKPITRGVLSAGNRWAVLPMEGWDGTTDGHPSDLTRRRWTRFGESGAKVIWGGEAVAVRHDGRANPNQLVINASDASAPSPTSGRACSTRIASDTGTPTTCSSACS